MFKATVIRLNPRSGRRRSARLNLAVSRDIAWAAREGANIARASIMTSPRGGRWYTRAATEKGQVSTHKRRTKASAPGEPPASDSGTLVEMVAHRIDADRMGAEVGAKTEYALYLEEGTKDKLGNVRMAPRPFMQPAADKIKPRLRKRIRESVKKTKGRRGRRNV